MSNRTTTNNNSIKLTETYTYHSPITGNAGTTAGLVYQQYIDAPGYDKTYTYTYQADSMLSAVSVGGKTTTYGYDSANQLIRENNQEAGKTWTWEYDDAGNILSRKEYAYTTGTLGSPISTLSFSYEDSAWGDLMTACNGQATTHDELGNPLTSGNWSFTWEHGRQLASMSDGNTTWNYTYNADGLRVYRDNGTTSYRYTYTGDKLVQMHTAGHIIRFTYAADSRPLTIVLDGATYYYVTNIMGDVVAILDSNGNPVVNYTYDAWGTVLSTTGSMASTLGMYNPLRYRGYIYDHESGLYYLQSRYYDPDVGRFINADAYAATGQGLLGNNMFSYCNNNPIVYIDRFGTIPYNDSWLDESFREAGRLLYEFFTGRTHPERQYSETNIDVIEAQNEYINNGLEAAWNAYQRGYNLHQESELRLAKSNLDMFDSPEDIERSIDVIGSTFGFSMATYQLATVITAANPPAGAVAWAIVGVAWSVRAICRDFQ